MNRRACFDVFLMVPHRIARFASFVFDLDTLELRNGAAPAPLEPQPARLLALLASRQGSLVSHEEAAQCLWGDGTHVARADGLHYAIRQIRLALGDSAGSPAFVETLPRRGYRFVAPVRLTSGKQRGRASRRLMLAAAAALALVIAESLPNRHHEVAMWLLGTLHAAIF